MEDRDLINKIYYLLIVLEWESLSKINMVIHLCAPNAFVQLLWVFLIALSFIYLQIHFLWHLQKPLKLLGKHYTHNMSAGSQRWGTSFAVYRLYYDDITYIMPEWCLQARYKLQLDPTLEEVKKLCNTCRKFARTERVLFHYNGHGVPKPTANGEIWVFNKVNVAKTLHKLLHCLSMCVFDEVPFFFYFLVQSYTQYIPLPITDLDSWLKTPSIYVFDCSAAGMIVKAFLEVWYSSF